MSRSISPLVRKIVKNATPSQQLKLRALLNDPSKVCEYDGILLYDDLIEKAAIALNKGRLGDSNLLLVLDKLVRKKDLASVFT